MANVGREQNMLTVKTASDNDVKVGCDMVFMVGDRELGYIEEFKFGGMDDDGVIRKGCFISMTITCLVKIGD